MKRENISTVILDVLFSIAIVICCFILVYITVQFTNSIFRKESIVDGLTSYSGKELKNSLFTTTSCGSIKTVNNEPSSQTDICINDSNSIRVSILDDSKIEYVEKLLEYATMIQELESQSSSNGIITFTYQFISGVLIGVATFLIKKATERANQISEVHKSLIDALKSIDNLNSQMIYSKMIAYTLRIHSSFQILRASLSNGANEDKIGASITGINRSIRQLTYYMEKYDNELVALDYEHKNEVREELRELLIITEEIRQANNPVLAKFEDSTQRGKGISEWNNELAAILEILEHKGTENETRN